MPDPTTNGAEIVPFGKYRDRPVTDLLADRGYVDWLLSQPWFAQKQPTIYNVIIGAGGPEPQDTPEHNAMQARYLEPAQRCLLAARYLPDRRALEGIVARLLSPSRRSFAREPLARSQTAVRCIEGIT